MRRYKTSKVLSKLNEGIYLPNKNTALCPVKVNTKTIQLKVPTSVIASYTYSVLLVLVLISYTLSMLILTHHQLNIFTQSINLP